MQLTWSNTADIAAALLQAYPETDRLSLGRDQLLHLVFALPAFKDKGVLPSPALLDHIRWTWMRLADSFFEERICRQG